jgi:hypothetical protein
MSQDAPSKVIDAMFAGLGDWRGATLTKLRTLIKQADPDVVEELKWKKASNPTGVPVWSDEGMICTGEVYKDHVKLTFAKGASLDDPHGVFNASLDGNLRRAVDVYETDKVNATAFKAIIQAAVALNKAGKSRR